MNSNPDKLYTPNEVAEILLVSPTTVRFWAQKGELKALTTPGGHRRFKYEFIEDFAKARGIVLPGNSSVKRILIVDDDVSFGHYLVELLDKVKDVETELVNYSFSAGLKVRSFKPDIVLLDIMMPGIDGVKVCHTLKADAALKNIRIIGMTGHPSNENIDAMLAAGAEACLEKPINAEELLTLLGLER